MSDRSIKNATIESISINDADRGLLTASMSLDYGNSGHQGFGGYTLYLPKNFAHHKLESCAGHFIWRVMEVAGVTKWEHIPGKSIRVDSEHSKVHGIGHITKDDWFYPAKDFASIAEDKV